MNQNLKVNVGASDIMPDPPKYTNQRSTSLSTNYSLEANTTTPIPITPISPATALVKNTMTFEEDLVLSDSSKSNAQTATITNSSPSNSNSDIDSSNYHSHRSNTPNTLSVEPPSIEIEENNNNDINTDEKENGMANNGNSSSPLEIIDEIDLLDHISNNDDMIDDHKHQIDEASLHSLESQIMMDALAANIASSNSNNIALNASNIDMNENPGVSPSNSATIFNVATGVSRAYRQLLVHESQRLKHENERLLQKVERMRYIRTSMQTIFDQLQDNDQQLRTIQTEENAIADESKQALEEDALEIEHLNEIIDNRHQQILIKQKQREERKRLRQAKYLRFHQARLLQQQQHASAVGNQSSFPSVAAFIPRICSTPMCNHPVRPGKSICCRGCMRKQHSPSCTQRALKALERRRLRALHHVQLQRSNNNRNTTTNGDNNEENGNNDNNNEIDDYIPLTTPHLSRSTAHSYHTFRTKSKKDHLYKHYYTLNSSNHRPRPHPRRYPHSISGRTRTRSLGNNINSRFVYCDKCRCQFETMTQLDHHKALHHSPVIATGRGPRLPPPIPELTSSYLTTVPSHHYQHAKTNATLPPTPLSPNDDDFKNDSDIVNDDMNPNNPFSSPNTRSTSTLARLTSLTRKNKKQETVNANALNNSENNSNNNENSDRRKRKHSLSSFFSMLNPNSRKHNDEDQVKEMKETENHSNNNNERVHNSSHMLPPPNQNFNNVSHRERRKSHLRRRSLGSFLLRKPNHNNNHTTTNIIVERSSALRNGNNNSQSDTENEQDDRNSIHQTKLKELRQKLKDLKRKTHNSAANNNNNNNEDIVRNDDVNAIEVNNNKETKEEKVQQSLWHELSALDPSMAENYDNDNDNNSNHDSDDDHNLNDADNGENGASEHKEQDMMHRRNLSSLSIRGNKPHHRRSNATTFPIFPFITSSAEEHDEEEKSNQPLPPPNTPERRSPQPRPLLTNPTDLQLMQLKREKYRKQARELRRTRSMNSSLVPPQYRHANRKSNRHENNHNSHREVSGLLPPRRTRHQSHYYSRSPRPHMPNNDNPSNHFTYRRHRTGSNRNVSLHDILMSSRPTNQSSAASNNEHNSHNARAHSNNGNTNNNNSTNNSHLSPPNVESRYLTRARRLPNPPRPSRVRRHSSASNISPLTPRQRRQRPQTSHHLHADRSINNRYREIERLIRGQREGNGNGNGNDENESKELDFDALSTTATLAERDNVYNRRLSGRYHNSNPGESGGHNRDEQIARLLQQRDSLLETFQSINNSRHQEHNRSNSDFFTMNALRTRTHRRRSHRHSASDASNRVNITYLPIRNVQESDIGKGSDSIQSCSICQEKFQIGDHVKTLPCFHFFHVDEIDRWLANSRQCPVCRHSIDQVNFK